jgi:hypothetical protein
MLSALLATTMLTLPSNVALADVGAFAPEEEAAEPAEGEPAGGTEGAEPAEGEEATGEEATGEEATGEEATGEEPEGDEEGTEGETTEEEPEPEPEPAPEEVAPPEQPEGPQRPPEPTYGAKGRPAKGTGMIIAGGALLGLGIAGTITTALVTLNCSYDGPLKCKYQNQDRFLIPLTAAGALMGAILLAVGVGFRVRYKRWESWSPTDKRTALVPVAFPGGGGLTYGTRF